MAENRSAAHSWGFATLKAQSVLGCSGSFRRWRTHGALAFHIFCLAHIGPAMAAEALSAQPEPQLLESLFGDNAVLQRGQAIPLWGRASAGAQVVATLAGSSVTVQAGADGRWRAALPAMAAGGPHVLKVRSAGRETVARNMLIGDVWLCSGQSNMAMPVSRALNSKVEIATSDDFNIRLLVVQQDISLEPEAEFRRPLGWAVAGPETIGNFSAVCFFFAKEPRRHHDVPIGLIASAWSGSAIRAWMSVEALEKQGEYQEQLAMLRQFTRDRPAAYTSWGKWWEKWWQQRGEGEPWNEPEGAAGWIAVPAMVPWERWGIPTLANYNGMLWYRTELNLTAKQSAQSATLHLGNIDQADQTWINGRPVGASGSCDRQYLLPLGTLIAGTNIIVLNVFDAYAEGGIYGSTENRTLRLADGTSVPLDAAGWRYRIAGVAQPAPRTPWEPQLGFGLISNSMIAPLGNVGLAGVLWYQGETDSALNPESYDRLLSGLMADWRSRLGRQDLPFLVVSLANFGTPANTPGKSGWAELRDRTRTAVKADPQAALAITIELGDRWDIHPAQKQEVGRRLARAARHLVFGEAVSPSGPEAVSAQREGNEVTVSFQGVTGQLLTRGGEQVLAFELCLEDGTACHYAGGRVEGSLVRLEVAKDFAAGQVRYAWADNPLVNLFDEAHLPAGPFRIQIERNPIRQE